MSIENNTSEDRFDRISFSPDEDYALTLMETSHNIIGRTEFDRITFCTEEAFSMTVEEVIETAAYDDGYDGMPISGNVLATLRNAEAEDADFDYED
jgi:hypothetical protein